MAGDWHLAKWNLFGRMTFSNEAFEFLRTIPILQSKEDKMSNTIAEQILKLERIREEIREVEQALRSHTSPPSGYLPPEDEWRWADCNLWKPEGESDGKLAVLLRGDWREPDRVEVMRKDGTWETMRYAGTSNWCGPNQLERYTYRGDHPGGSQYTSRAGGGGVRAWYGDRFAFIPLPGPAKKRWE